MTCPATMSAAVTATGPAATNPLRSTMITLSTCFYGLRMNLRSATCGRNHETRRSEAQPRWMTEGHLLSCFLMKSDICRARSWLTSKGEPGRDV